MTASSINPLGLTAESFAHAARRLVRDGDTGALRLYANYFRTGAWDAQALWPDAHQHLPAPTIAPIHRLHASESDEGTVLKFTQQVPRALALSAVPSSNVAPASTTARAVSLTASILGQSATPLAQLAPLATLPSDLLETETVLIPMLGKSRARSYTLCVSSQVGCAMGCTFCQTAQMGLIRSLTPAEIVQQWFAAQHLLQRPDASAQIRNIVFMGMGEPLDNLDNVMAAIDVLTDRRGPNIASSRITVSTVGRIDGLARFKDFCMQPGYRRLGLAVSVNAPNDEIRSRIMPINRAMPMAALRRAIDRWPRSGTGHIMVEYVLIPGVNDEPLHAQQLADWVSGHTPDRHPDPALAPMACCVNVIPYNPREGSPWPAPDEATIDRFIADLTSHGLYVKRRRTKGRDQMAACGQLGNLAYRRRPARTSAPTIPTAP
ncbi:MAG: 23S rRNA (adenine(2503)-C(2))-methyltransferase RlmN [Phycisphaerales bacterium]|nr:23S rRNA (adenine(2503)-C(2))-methyltransferase RlmN [Phycisphaerales bacterium]